jgi:hypothetical protein
MKHKILAGLFILFTSTALPQKVTVVSPNNKVSVALYNVQNTDVGVWFLKVSCFNNDKISVAIPRIKLGLSRSDQEFSKDLKFLKSGKPLSITEQYTALHGKRASCSNSASETVVYFENPGKAKLNLIIRAYNDGVAFSYEFPEKEGSFTVKDELTSYDIPPSAKRWLEKWNTANEGLYSVMNDDNTQQGWCYPALFNSPDNACWYLIHEADVNRGYCGSKLSNAVDKSLYKITFPDPKDGNGQGESSPTIALPWKSPWRIIILGGLSDIVESTLTEDVCPPSVIKNTDWIRPGLVSWNY